MATAWRRERDGRLTPSELSAAEPGPGRVAIAVEAVAIDRLDATPPGRVPGAAAVGVVTAVGVAADEPAETATEETTEAAELEAVLAQAKARRAGG